MRQRLVESGKPWDARSIENSVGPGTPDLNYAEGWFELKQLDGWPARPDTVVSIDHYTPQQRVWIQRRGRHGGRVHLVLQVRREWFIFDWRMAAESVGYVTRAQLIAMAGRYWTRYPGKEIFEWALAQR